MKISLEWLNSCLDRPVTADEAEKLLTDQGMPIESRLSTAGGDTVIDVEVTSNRPDCLCHLGIAREIAAGSGRAVREPQVDLSPFEDVQAAGELTCVEIQSLELCPLYTARVIRGVKVGPSPDWMVRRLEAIGLRSINNVVDVTNYVMFEMGQPLHAFDMARLEGGRIVVRKARAGEPFVSIDGGKRVLAEESCPNMLVIADTSKPAAVAGIMGGLNSEVGPGTTQVLLEAALFDPLSIRRAGRALKLASDSSYRFERGIDPRGVERASRRAAALMVELAGGRLAAGVVRVGAPEPFPRALTLRVDRCNQVLGLELEGQQVVALLTRLGLGPRLDSAGEVIACTVPTSRLDLEREIDLIEEVGRLQGLDQVGVKRKIEIVARPIQPAVAARRKLGQALVAQGFYETVTFSFVPPRLGEPFLPAGAEALLIDDERRKAEPMLRPSLLPSLLACRKANQDVGNQQVKLYETAAVWHRQGAAVTERRMLALLADASKASESLRAMRGAVEELLRVLGGEVESAFVPLTNTILMEGAQINIQGQEAGQMGLLAPGLQKLFDLQTPLVCAQFDLEALIGLYPPQRTVRSLARFPGIERDLSVVVPDSMPWEKVRATVEAVQPALMEELRFLVSYRGKPIAAGRKSVSFRMVFRDPAATLRHEQVDPQVAAVVERLKSSLGAELRA